MSNLLWILVIYFLNLITVVISSSGDRSKFYVLCVDRCSLKDCKIGGEFKSYTLHHTWPGCTPISWEVAIY
ncbi:uncharacterized protein LOC117181859 isoform X2 [Belonocnema kinseyi]|uniref:uncharacterized protein LOC117181859 isoform X2 n=1 Tax=Belonocnema kinseyi TaxID=2817044 RepID=UPI00143D2DA3|nr:uncharacterized protein LOC117181859 isoform X2 [Belonocnema kinseyi]